VEGTQTTHISGADISSLVDALLVLQYCDDGRGLQRRLLVIKSRASAHSMAYHEMMITDRGIEVGWLAAEPETRKARR